MVEIIGTALGWGMGIAIVVAAIWVGLKIADRIDRKNGRA